MSRPTLRTLAAALGLSPSTISLALRGDPRIRPGTIARARAAAASAGYHADPVVSEGLSRARRREFFRETIAWALDRARGDTPWLAPLFAAAEARAGLLGYRLEFIRLSREPASLRRAARTWRARGVRGVILGPFAETWEEPGLPWDDFVWLSVGDSVAHPRLHRVGRDYALDIESAIEHLARRGLRRPGFVEERLVHHLFHQPMLRAALHHYHLRGERRAEAFIELESGAPVAPFRSWLRRLRPDCLLLARPLRLASPDLEAATGDLPRVILSLEEADAHSTGFTPNYGPMGESAVNLLHRLVHHPARGVPRERQSALISSIWRGTSA
jgi:LacI family transcriptional regulator